MANTEVERYDDVDTADVPSAAWGWSKISRKTWYSVGIFVILFLLGMLQGQPRRPRRGLVPRLVRRTRRVRHDPRLGAAQARLPALAACSSYPPSAASCPHA
jgi:hypothetical protein